MHLWGNVSEEPVTGNPNVKHNNDPVLHHGMLRKRGSEIVDKHGQRFEMFGMSLFWSMWSEQFWNEKIVNDLVDDWKVNMIRLPIGVTDDYCNE